MLMFHTFVHANNQYKKGLISKEIAVVSTHYSCLTSRSGHYQNVNFVNQELVIDFTSAILTIGHFWLWDFSTFTTLKNLDEFQKPLW